MDQRVTWQIFLLKFIVSWWNEILKKILGLAFLATLGAEF